MRSSSTLILVTEDEKADGTNWRKKILFLLVCSLVVMMGLLVALIVVSVKLADKEDPIFQNSTFSGFGEWKEVGQCSRECGGGKRNETRTCWLSDMLCFGNNTRQVDCNQHECQGWYL